MDVQNLYAKKYAYFFKDLYLLVQDSDLIPYWNDRTGNGRSFVGNTFWENSFEHQFCICYEAGNSMDTYVRDTYIYFEICKI